MTEPTPPISTERYLESLSILRGKALEEITQDELLIELHEGGRCPIIKGIRNASSESET